MKRLSFLLLLVNSIISTSIFDVINDINPYQTISPEIINTNNKDNDFIVKSENNHLTLSNDKGFLTDKIEKLEKEIVEMKLKFNNLIDVNQQMLSFLSQYQQKDIKNINKVETKIEIITPDKTIVKAIDNDNNLNNVSSKEKENKDQTLVNGKSINQQTNTERETDHLPSKHEHDNKRKHKK